MGTWNDVDEAIERSGLDGYAEGLAEGLKRSEALLAAALEIYREATTDTDGISRGEALTVIASVAQIARLALAEVGQAPGPDLPEAAPPANLEG